MHIYQYRGFREFGGQKYFCVVGIRGRVRVNNREFSIASFRF
jgi:hypothetical protein